MRSEYDDIELSELEQTLLKLQKEGRDLPSNSARQMNSYSLYYDDTLVTKRPSVSIYRPDNTYNEPDMAGISHCSSFGPMSFPDGAARPKRNLPTPPSQTPGSAAERKDSVVSYNQWGQNGDNGTCLKSYKEPTKRESLMRALDKSSSHDRTNPKFGRPDRPSCRNTVNWILFGILLTAIYVAIAYFVTKFVSEQLCGTGLFGSMNGGGSISFVYGEMELNNFNKSWSSTTEFEDAFIREMNNAVQETLFSDYWANPTVLGHYSLTTSGNNTTGTQTLICRFGLNLRLPPNRRRAILEFTRNIIDMQIAQLAPGAATIRCIALLDSDDIRGYHCEAKEMTTSRRDA